ncbi:hypothetical protein NL676_039358 [Syzygium grande]|nr:hypothetical protein NL676_039358 [Syzygium grande]
MRLTFLWQGKRLPGLHVLSNLDQTLPNTVEIIFASKGEGRGMRFTAIEMLRESLAEVVIGFYPFTGRLVMGSDGKMAVRCRGEGVPFIEAMTEDDIQMLGNISASDPPMLRKLVKHSDGAQTILEKPLLTVQPTLLVWGEQDQIFPLELGHRLQRHIGENAELVEIRNAGHAANLEKPKEFIKHLKLFLL